MKKFNFNYKNVVSILFIVFLTASCVLTFATEPIKILGGLARGYLNSSKEDNVMTKIGNGFSEFDSRINEYYFFHDLSINSYGGIQNIIGKDLIDDVDQNYSVLKLKNNYLTFKETEAQDYSKLSNYLTELKKTCNQVGSDLLYIEKIDKNTNDTSILPDNYPFIYNSNFNSFKKNLKKNKIDLLCIEDVVNQQNIDKYSLFFKTDHHWTPKAGLWVSQLISNSINKKYEYNLETNNLEISNYDIDTYKNAFLGSQGKRVGYLYSGIDDFDVITPKFSTDLELTVKSNNLYLKGSFEDTMINRKSITPDNLLNKDDTAYDTYMRGNHDLVEIKNNLVSNNKKAILVLDSYGCVVAPYLSLMFQELDCIDLRSFKEPLQEYISEKKPDIVLYMATNYQ